MLIFIWVQSLTRARFSSPCNNRPIPTQPPFAPLLGATLQPLNPPFPGPSNPPVNIATFNAAVTGGPTWTETPIAYWVTDTAGTLWQSLLPPPTVSTPVPTPSLWDPFPGANQFKAAAVWPFNGPSTSPIGVKPSVWPIWALDESGTLWWNSATFERLKNGLLIGPTWGVWNRFPAQIAHTIVSLAAAALPDGRIQIFASDSLGGLWSIWQAHNGAWPTTWAAIASPHGNFPGGVVATGKVLVPGGGKQTTISGQMIAMGQMPEGYLQLFVIDQSGYLFSNQKTSGSDPNSPWAGWTLF